MKDFTSKEEQTLFNAIHAFHAVNECNLSCDDLRNLVTAQVGSNEFFNGVIDNIATLDVSDTTTSTLLNAVIRKRKLQELSLAAYELHEGKGDEAKFAALLEAVNGSTFTLDDGEEFEFITTDLNELLNQVVNSPGLHWRMKTLNKSLGPLRKGNFGFVFARPETGKTTFLCSEVTHMASQLSDDDGPILWIANEEPGENIQLRVYQAAFGIDLPTLQSDVEGWAKKYNEVFGTKLRISKLQTVSKFQLEKMCAKLKPSLLIVDQLDKITGFDNDREDLKLGSLYQWARELAKQWCPVIGICQADGTGEGVKWLTMGNVANAKTAKQAEADWILGIGKQNSDGYENIRYLHLSKNKLPGGPFSDPNLRHGKLEVLIEPALGRYKDLY